MNLAPSAPSTMRWPRECVCFIVWRTTGLRFGAGYGDFVQLRLSICAGNFYAMANERHHPRWRRAPLVHLASGNPIMKIITRFSLFSALILAPFSLLAQPPRRRRPIRISWFPRPMDGLPGAGPVPSARIGFKKTWLEHRSAWVKRVEQDHGAFVFLGDSITQKWGDDSGRQFPGSRSPIVASSATPPPAC